jgi:hypothetical protein
MNSQTASLCAPPSRARPVRFTELQAGEIAHKACVVRDEPDLQESYELTQEQAEVFAQAFLAAQHGGLVEVLPEWVDVITGELENAIEIALANAEVDLPGTHLAYIRSMRGAIAKTKGSTK